MSHLNEHDIDEQAIQRIYSQAYIGKPTIQGVQVVNLKNHVGEDGALSEVMRVTESGEVEGISGFKIALPASL